MNFFKKILDGGGNEKITKIVVPSVNGDFVVYIIGLQKSTKFQSKTFKN